MLHEYRQWSIVTSWLVVAATPWFVAVPTWISVATFGWVNAAALAVAGILVVSVRSRQATQPIAQILYDTEHPTDR